MKNKNMIIVGCILLVVFIIGGLILLKNALLGSKSIDIKLDTNYQDIIYISDNAKFLMVINDNKVSNLLFLNKESKDSLANKKIEKKNLDESIELIVDHLKNNNLLNDTNDIEIKSLKQSNFYSDIVNYYNKDLVIYGVSKKVMEGSFTLDTVIDEFHLKPKENELENLKELEKLSKSLLEK